jgi:hypothetical protein
VAGTVQSVAWALRVRYGAEGRFEIHEPDKSNPGRGERLVIAFFETRWNSSRATD